MLDDFIRGTQQGSKYRMDSHGVGTPFFCLKYLAFLVEMCSRAQEELKYLQLIFAYIQQIHDYAGCILSPNVPELKVH